MKMRLLVETRPFLAMKPYQRTFVVVSIGLALLVLPVNGLVVPQPTSVGSSSSLLTSVLVPPRSGRIGRGKNNPSSKRHQRSVYQPVNPLQAVPAASVSVVAAAAAAATPWMGYFYMFLLALQFAFQPVLTQAYAPTNIIKGTYVFAQECVRTSTTLLLLIATGSWQTATTGWTWQSRLPVVGFPAFLYLIQSHCTLAAYQCLPPITYNVLNQTKTLAAAVWCYFLIGQMQSRLQMVSLVILLLSALVMESVVPLPFWKSNKEEEKAVTAKKDQAQTKNEETTDDSRRNYILGGIVPILAASLISGLAGAWTQKCLGSYNSLLFSLELSVTSILLLLVSTSSRAIWKNRQTPSSSTTTTEGKATSWTQGWTLQTWIPVITNALGGIIVGLVTKYAGAVRKGFALIVGVFLSGLLQNSLQLSSPSGSGSGSGSGQKRKRVEAHQWVGGVLAGISLWMYARYPPPS